jgi:hypothetical protein
MSLVTVPRYQDRMPVRSASLRLAWPALRAAVALVLASMSRSAMDRAQS